MATFIYALCEPCTLDVRYIGKADDPRARLTSHLRDAAETRKARWLRRLTRNGQRPMLRILETVEADRWQAAEQRWIAFYRANGADLTNLTDGGEGLHGASPDTRAKIAAAARARMNDPALRALVFAPERDAKISAALKGRLKTKEHIAKLPQNRPGRRLTPERAAKARAFLREHGWHWPKGVSPSNETRARIGEALRGNTHTLGRVMPEHERRQRSEANKGQRRSAVTRERIRRAALARWQRQRTEVAP